MVRGPQLARMGSFHLEFVELRLRIEPAVQADALETLEADLIHDARLGPEQMAADDPVVAPRDRHMDVELRLGPHRDAPVEREEFVAVRVDLLLVALRREEADLEVLEHADPPVDGCAVDAVGA